jgi:hypothetical protein
MVLNFVYFAVPEMLKIDFYSAFMKTHANYADLTERRSRIYVPAY